MNAALSIVLLATGAFVGTNLDNLLALSGQLAATERSRHRRIIDGQVAATVVLLGISALAGLTIARCPLRRGS